MKTALMVAGILLWGATDAPIARWETASGGHDKIAAIHAIYREATVEVGTFKGTIKVWHTSDGRYRKEEGAGGFASIETFDGTIATAKQGDQPPQTLIGPARARAISSAYANANAMFFVFFPERRHGTVTVDPDGTIVMQPDGGIDWRVTLDSDTSLPKRMVHQQADRTVTVDLVAYDTFDGVKLEKEIHRSTGDPRFDATIHFTKTVLNPPIDAALFAIQ